MTDLLAIEGLSIDIGGRSLVRSVSLTLAPGEIVGLVGESGSGKSLTALSVPRLLPGGATVTGSIRLGGEELLGLGETAMRRRRGRDIGIVFQEPMTALNPVMRIGDQVAEVLRYHGVGDARARAAETLDLVGLPARLVPHDRYPHQLSGGQRQRVAIAIAMALRPRLLVADEPTTALDVTNQAAIMDLFRNLVAETGMGLLLITHDLALVAGMAARIAVMRAGEIVETAAAAALLRGGNHPYTSLLVASSTVPPRLVARDIDARAEPALSAVGIVREHRLPAPSPFARRPVFRALDQVDLAVAPGECVALVGESGSGKSTLLRCLLALETPQAGEVSIHGAAFSQAGRAAQRLLRRKIQVVFQDPGGSLDPRWLVGRIIAEPLALQDPAPSPAERHRLVEAMLERVGLEAADARRYPHEFSGGQRQRIAIARALIVEPSIILLDEATSALDASVKVQILDLLADLAAERGLAYLYVSHDLATVRRIADRVLVMHQGKIVEAGPTEQIFSAPSQPYTASLIAASPTLGSVAAVLSAQGQA
jgi:peptide/nickel transport system ATP-binding protein